MMRTSWPVVDEARMIWHETVLRTQGSDL